MGVFNDKTGGTNIVHDISVVGYGVENGLSKYVKFSRRVPHKLTSVKMDSSELSEVPTTSLLRPTAPGPPPRIPGLKIRDIKTQSSKNSRHQPP